MYNGPQRKRLRLPEYNYARPGAYFVTVCARHGVAAFGCMCDGHVMLSKFGAAVAWAWNEIPLHYAGVTLDAFVVMPNHVHGILLFGDAGADHGRPLPIVMQSFKAAASRRAGHPLWQRGYFERIVRNEAEQNLIRHYVDENPARVS